MNGQRALQECQFPCGPSNAHGQAEPALPALPQVRAGVSVVGVTGFEIGTS